MLILFSTFFGLKAKAVSSKYLETFTFKDSSFEAFYLRFISDSTFQLNHIDFPIKGRYHSYETEKEWTKNDWPYIFWDLRNKINTTDDSLSIQQNSHSFFYGSYCTDCGFSFEMEFTKKSSEWNLSYRQENNY